MLSLLNHLPHKPSRHAKGTAAHSAMQVEELEVRTLLATSLLGGIPALALPSMPLPVPAAVQMLSPVLPQLASLPSADPPAAPAIVSPSSLATSSGGSGSAPITSEPQGGAQATGFTESAAAQGLTFSNQPISPNSGAQANTPGEAVTGQAPGPVEETLILQPIIAASAVNAGGTSASPFGGPITFPLTATFTQPGALLAGTTPIQQATGQATPDITAVMTFQPIPGAVLSPLPGQSLPSLAASPNADITMPDANTQSNYFTEANPILLLLVGGGPADRDPEDIFENFEGGDIFPGPVNPLQQRRELLPPPMPEAPAAPPAQEAPARPAPMPPSEALAPFPDTAWPLASEAYFAEAIAPSDLPPVQPPPDLQTEARGSSPEAVAAMVGFVLLGGASWQRETRRALEDRGQRPELGVTDRA